MSSARKKQSVALGCLLLLALLGTLAIRSNQLEAQISKESLNGLYELRASARAENESANAAAIRAATQRLEPTTARRWRGTLDVMAMPQKRIQISNTSQEIAIATGGREAIRSPADGTVREESPSLSVQQRFDGATLVKQVTSATFVGKEQLPTPIQHTTRYSLGPDGKTLSVTTAVSGGLLVEPLELHMTYDRVDEPAAKGSAR